jgi:hypothetical protein
MWEQKSTETGVQRYIYQRAGVDAVDPGYERKWHFERLRIT